VISFIFFSSFLDTEDMTLEYFMLLDRLKVEEEFRDVNKSHFFGLGDLLLLKALYDLWPTVLDLNIKIKINSN